MPRVGVQRTRDDDTIKLFHVQQTTVIFTGLNARRHLLGGVAPVRVNVSHGHELNVWHLQDFFEEFCAASAHADHPHTNAVVGAQHSWRLIGRQSGGSDGCLF